MSSSKVTTEPVVNTEAVYDLSTNNLSKLVEYTQRPSGVALISKVALPAGALITPITTHTFVPAPLYSTVQTGRDSHIELNSALLYMNHSCQPSVELDTDQMIVRVARDRDLNVGDDLTFFYPSTEWKFDRPFRCLCGSGKGVCVEELQGASALDSQTLKRWYINPHILELAKERDEGRLAATAA